MRGPKADVVLEGSSLLDRAVSAMLEVLEDVVVVSSRPVGPVDLPLIPDITPGAGPLGGVEAALVYAESSGHDGALVLACDLPLVGPELLRAVVAASDQPSHRIHRSASQR